MAEGSANFRDLGGIAGHAGRPLLAGRFLRSGQLADLTAADLARLVSCGVSVVCDLRTANERAAAPNPWPRPASPEATGVRTVLAPDRRGSSAAQPAAWLQRLRDPGFDADAARAYMLTGYRSMASGFASVLAELFRSLDDDAPVTDANRSVLLVHCVAGKDRTGFVVAMLLWALGATREAIVADYLASTAYAPPRDQAVEVERALAPRDEADRERMRRARSVMAGVDRLYLEEAWAETARRYGSVDRYLSEAAGLGAARRVHLRERFLAR